MSVGNLQVTAVTIRGLAENGIHNVDAFLGCYIDVSDKHRTQTQQGPEPQWNQSLTLSIPENKTTLYLEIVNENSNNPGVIGRGSYDFSPVVYQNERLNDVWVPMYSSSNGTTTVGQVLIRLDKQQQQQQQYQGGAPPAYSGSFGSNEYPQEKQHPPPFDRQSSFASLGPDQPLPENYGTGNPPPFTPPATSSNNPPVYPTSSYSPQAGGYPMPGTPPATSSNNPPAYPTSSYSPQAGGYPGTPLPEQTSPQQGQKEKEKSADWMKIGLGAAAALGVGAFAAHEYKEHQEKHHQHNKH